LQLQGNFTDQQYCVIREWVDEELDVKIFSITTVGNVRRKHVASLIEQLDITAVVDRNLVLLGAVTNLHATLVTLLDLLDCKLDKTIWKLSADARPNGKQSEISIGIVPLSLTEDVQSAASVYPVAMFQGKEDVPTYNTVLSTLRAQLQNIERSGIERNAVTHIIEWLLVTDLKTMWTIEGFGDDDDDCPYCSVPKVERLQKKGATWSRDDLPRPTALLGISPKRIVVCMLHARLRIVDEFVDVLVHRLRMEPNGTEKLKSAFAGLGLHIEVYEEEKEWKATRFSGDQSEKVFLNIPNLARLWPKRAPKYYDDHNVKELREECNKRMPALPTRTKDADTGKSRYLRKDELIHQLQLADRRQRKRVPVLDNEKNLFVDVWSTLVRLYKAVSYGPDDDDNIFDKWDEIVEDWKEKFRKLHTKRLLRIYPHIIIDHGKDLYKEHGPLARLSQQGFEAANKRDVANFSRHTPHFGGRLPRKTATTAKDQERNGKEINDAERNNKEKGKNKENENEVERGNKSDTNEIQVISDEEENENDNDDNENENENETDEGENDDENELYYDNCDESEDEETKEKNEDEGHQMDKERRMKLIEKRKEERGILRLRTYTTMIVYPYLLQKMIKKKRSKKLKQLTTGTSGMLVYRTKDK